MAKSLREREASNSIKLCLYIACLEDFQTTQMNHTYSARASRLRAMGSLPDKRPNFAAWRTPSG
jgi:hypothetical protein